MNASRLTLWSIAAVLVSAVAASADVFDRHTSDLLRTHAGNTEAIPSLSMSAAQELKPLSRTETSPAVLIRTDEGNWCKAIVSWGFRRGDEGLTPVLLIERYVTYRDDNTNVARASGSDVMLFPGFAFNFDIGQVVPAGQGGDVTFSADKLLTVQEPAKLYPIDGSLLQADAQATERPADRDGVLPADFAGTWKVNIDGRWRGTWRLRVIGNGRVTGDFTSDETKSTYELEGRVAAPPQHARLTIQLDNAQQQIDAYLWTTDKSAMAGTSSLAGQTFGFYALRVTEEE